MPEGWAWARLNNVGLITDTGYPFNASEFSKDQTKGMAIIRIRDILRGYSETYSNEKCPESYIVNKGEILIGMDGDFNIAKWKSEPALLNQRVCRIKKCHSSINLDYFFYLLEIPLKEINKNTSSVTVKHLSNKQIENLLFPIPPIKIQNEIVTKIQQSLSLVEIIENGRNDIETTIKKTKSKILDLAIHGKLVPQDSNDEPASILLEKLRAEKEEKIAKGELKRDKNDSYIYKGSDNCYYEKFPNGRTEDVDVPFEIPATWQWCKLGSICDYGKCISVNANNLKSEDWILDLEDIEKDTGKIIAFKTFAERKSESTKHKFSKGQVLYSKLRPYLNKVVIAPKDGYCTSEILPLNFNNLLTSRYAQLFLMSSYFLGLVNMVTYGVKMPRLGTEDAKKMLIPVPPLQEQHRIIDKIDTLFSRLDNIHLELV